MRDKIEFIRLVNETMRLCKSYQPGMRAELSENGIHIVGGFGAVGVFSWAWKRLNPPGVSNLTVGVTL